MPMSGERKRGRVTWLSAGLSVMMGGDGGLAEGYFGGAVGGGDDVDA